MTLEPTLRDCSMVSVDIQAKYLVRCPVHSELERLLCGMFNPGHSVPFRLHLIIAV